MFKLKLKYGVEVATLEELRENFDLELVVEQPWQKAAPIEELNMKISLRNNKSVNLADKNLFRIIDYTNLVKFLNVAKNF